MAGKVSKIMKLGEMGDFVILRRGAFGMAGFVLRDLVSFGFSGLRIEMAHL